MTISQTTYLVVEPYVKAKIDEILVKEGNGKFTNDPKDSGGPTRWGVTERTARANGYTGPMDKLPREFAFNLYVVMYWQKPGFHLIAPVFKELAERCLDFGVVAGQSTSGKFLQRTLNVLNRNERDYKNVIVDGVIGSVSMGAMNAFLAKRGQDGRKVLLGGTVSLMSNHFITLAESRPKDEEYVYGWLLNRSIGQIVCLGK